MVRDRILEAGYRQLVRPALFRSCAGDAEAVHERTLAMISRLGESVVARTVVRAALGRQPQPVTVAGIRFGGRVGLAAGMDKNGVGVRAWGSLGFGFAELGTVTAQAQPGNETPRLFRLPASQAIINRMGFNNDGAQAMAARLWRAGVRRGNNAAGIPIGISLGKSRIAPLTAAVEDYLTSFRLLAPYADYVAINVSSPNTPGLRSLQDGRLLSELVGALTVAAARQDQHQPVPIFVKIGPDLSNGALDEVLSVCADAGVQGLIATNTTLARDGLDYRDLALATEVGGLSGSPLTIRSREVVRYLTARTALPVIGVGGIMSRDDAAAMLDAGAVLLQVYSGYIYAGPTLVAGINADPSHPHRHAGKSGENVTGRRKRRR